MNQKQKIELKWWNETYSNLLGSMSNGYAYKMIESSFKYQQPTDKG